jgi:hypothetical protein
VIEAPEVGQPVLRIVHKGGTEAYALLDLSAPGITGASYALRGQVRYSGLEAVGYLEMWSQFANGDRFFSRTLSDTGPLSQLTGSSGWRYFVIPFYLGERSDKPERLLVNLVFTGPGQVDVGPVELVQFAAGEDPLAATFGAKSREPWWLPATGAWIGAVGGSAVGLLGALAGALAGRGRRRASGLMMLIGLLETVVAAPLLITGGLALDMGQPFYVYFPALLVGTLCLLAGPGQIWLSWRLRHAPAV